MAIQGKKLSELTEQVSNIQGKERKGFTFLTEAESPSL